MVGKKNFSSIVKRELEVAFSKHAQPLWFRLLKYILLVLLFYFYGGTRIFWIILGIVFILGLLLHLWYRHKTEGWTKSYGLWNYDKNKPA
jgi:hypothetical protein